jgi:predicted ArsR family transcriptional regulator
MHATNILEYLRTHGQKLDVEIAVAMGIPLAKVSGILSDLSARGEISRCSVTQFSNGKPIEGMLSRAVGFFPPKTQGRKSGKNN